MRPIATIHSNGGNSCHSSSRGLLMFHAFFVHKSNESILCVVCSVLSSLLAVLAEGQPLEADKKGGCIYL